MVNKKNYVLVYREDKLDAYLRGIDNMQKGKFKKAVALFKVSPTEGKDTIDAILKGLGIAHFLPAGVRVYEPHVCGFARVIETLECI